MPNLQGHPLESAEKQFDTVFDRAPVMIHSIGKDGRIVKVNSLWLANLGYTEQEVLGRLSTDFLTEKSRTRALQETLPLFWRVGSARSIGYQLVKKDGDVVDVLLDAELSLDAAGRTTTIAAIYRHNDLLQWRQALATIKALQELAELSTERTSMLTERQREVLRSLASGARNKEISKELRISVRTVRYHIENLYQILGVHTRTEAVRVATELGLLNN